MSYIRYDDNKNYSNVISPKAVIKYLPSDFIAIAYSASKSWRSPTFADIYGSSLYFIPPNPDIKPEKSMENEISAKLNVDDLELSLNGYYYDVSDKISYDSFTYKAVNLSKGYVKGAEVAASYSFYPFFFSIGGNFMASMGKEKGESSYKQLPYMPSSKIVLNMKRFDPVLFDINFKSERTGEYFTKIDKKGKRVPAHILSSIEISKKLSELEFFCSVSNLFNSRYAVTADSFNGYYPGEPRNIKAGMKIFF